MTQNVAVLAPAVMDVPRPTSLLGLSSPAASLAAAFNPDAEEEPKNLAASRNTHGPKGMPASRAMDVLLAQVWKNLASPFAGVQVHCL